MVIAKESGLVKAWVNGHLALDTSLESKHQRKEDSLRLVNPGKASFEVQLLTRSHQAINISVVTWHSLPDVLVAPFLRNWPENAQAGPLRSRARKVQRIELKIKALSAENAEGAE